MSIARRPADALLIPESLKQGRRKLLRVNSILAIAEPLLGVRFERGERVHMRRTLLTAPHHENPRQMTCLLFCTASEHDTLNYPTDHPKHPRPMYRWEQDGPIRIGYFVDPPEERLSVTSQA